MISIIGHEKILSNLKKMAASDSLGHAHLFIGPKSVGKFTTALHFSAFLNCSSLCGECEDCRLFESRNHSDILILEGEEKLKIEDSRKVKEFINLKPYRAKRKIVLIKDVSRFTIEAANSLLKTFEEPDGKTIFILTAENLTSVLGTIISRCQVTPFSQVPLEEIKNSLLNTLEAEESERILRLSLGRVGKAYQLLANKEEEQSLIEISANKNYSDRFSAIKNLAEGENLRDSLDNFVIYLRDILLIKQGLSDRIVNLKEINNLKIISAQYSNEKIKKLLEQAKEIKDGIGGGVNTKLQLENISLMI